MYVWGRPSNLREEEKKGRKEVREESSEKKRVECLTNGFQMAARTEARRVGLQTRRNLNPRACTP